MALAAQLAKLLTKGAQKVMSPVMKHEPTLRVLTPEQEAASYAPIRTSSYGKQTDDMFSPAEKQTDTVQGEKEQEIIRNTIDQPLYHTSRSAEKIDTFDPERLKDKAIKGNVSSGTGAYFTPSLEYSRGIYYSRIVPEEIQNKYINKGEAHKIWDAEKLYRRGEFSPEEIEDLVYDAHTYKAKLKEDFNPIVILGKKNKTNNLNILTSEERADFIRRNPSYQDGSPIIKHKGIWKSQQELEEIGFEGVVDARQEFKRIDEEGNSKHEVAVWPSALSKISHELMRGIGAREGVPIKKRINVKTASREEIKEHYKISTEDKNKAKEAARDEELEEAAKQIKAGTNKEEAAFGINKNKTWDELVKEKNPISIITDMPTVPSAKVIDAVLQPTQAKKGILVQVKKGEEIEGLVYKDPSTIDNKIVSARIDINTRDNFGIWVDTIHEPKPDGRPGKVIGYTNSVYLEDVIFHTPDLEVAQNKALDIATGESKNPFAGMTGTFKNKTIKENYQLTKKALDQQNKPQGMKPLAHLEWVQIGMNPKRGSYFYDKKTGQPILSAKEVVQVGQLVFARNVKRGNASDFLTFNKGGVVDMRNGGKVGAAVVAASLMASGGQAMDMRNGGVVGMVQGGPVIDYATPEEKEFDKDYDAPAEVSKQMEALLAKRQAAVDYGGLEQPSLTLQNTASDIFVTNMGKTEGTTWHPDLKKIKTSPYGINTALHKNLLDNLQTKAKVSKWEDIPLSMLKEAAKKLFEDEYLKPYVDGKVSGTTASTFNSLSEESKFLVGSSAFNGGNYPSLVNNLSAWEKNPTMNTLEAVISETPRSVRLNGVLTRVKGLDNRAVRDLEIAGIIDKSNSRHRTALRKWLPLTTEVEFPTPPVPRFKPTNPRQK